MIGLHRITKESLFLIGLLTVIILLSGCLMIRTNQVEEDIHALECICMNVNGTVLGKLKINTTIALYKAESFDYESIMENINEAHPDRIAEVSANQSFSFYCLPEGHYLLNIPSPSYDFSLGSPIPAENSQGDLKVEAILQGGNAQNLFSAFSVKRIS
jgi:hypothetical protein